MREVFRHLVTAEGTRAVLTRTELDELLAAAGARGGGRAAVGGPPARHRESEAGGERVEVIHEALLAAWPRLVAWRREDAEGARLRDQLRAAARQWDERGRPSGLLWRGDALAEYRAVARPLRPAPSPPPRRPSPPPAWPTPPAAAASAAPCSPRSSPPSPSSPWSSSSRTAGSSAQRARAVHNEQAGRRRAPTGLHDLLLNQYESQGRRLLLADDPVQALAYLHKAAELGASGPAHDFLVAQAVRATDGERLVVRHDSGIVRVRFSPDGTPHRHRRLRQARPDLGRGERGARARAHSSGAGHPRRVEP